MTYHICPRCQKSQADYIRGRSNWYLSRSGILICASCATKSN